MKILIAPNAFKGSMSPAQAAFRIESGLRRAGLDSHVELVRLPLADGGDGTLEAFMASGGARIVVHAEDALGRPLEAAYGLLPDGTAVIEMALASGLARLDRAEVNGESALRASTFGTGLVLRAALESGARRFIVGLGGSATTDAGMGCLHALGTRLLDDQGKPLGPGGGALQHLARIDLGGLDPRLYESHIVLATDVINPAVGPNGAAHVFAPQKGAGPAEVEALERGIDHCLRRFEAQTGRAVRAIPGGGAAGAFSAGLMAAFGTHPQIVEIVSGVDLILDHHGFDRHLQGAALVITGEGQLDDQTLDGKGPLGLARRAAAFGVPTVALAGGLRADDSALHAAGIAAALPIVSGPMTLETAIAHGSDLLEQAALRLGYWLQVGSDLARDKHS